ncbi:MAG: thioredoxin family protein [Acidobacteriia bacterium]|nr:thioredoxin family protein [Terriglobia bacterium]
MKTARAVCVVALLISWPVAARAQSRFEPLDGWKTAVVANNQAALAAFYSTNPPAQNQIPQGNTRDAGEEPRFWSAVAAQGLSDFEPKVLEILRPQTGVVELVLRIEFKLKTSSGVQPFVVEAAQVWAQQGDGWQILATQRSDPEPNPPRRLPVPTKPNTDLYPPPEEAQPEINAALASAAKDHKRVILVFGGNWCYDCHVLDATFHSKAIAPLVNANFHVVHVNIGEEYDKNLDLAAKYQVPLKKGVPALVVLDPSGKLVYSQQAGEFENSTRIGPADVTAFLKKWAPPRQN